MPGVLCVLLVAGTVAAAPAWIYGPGASCPVGWSDASTWSGAIEQGATCANSSCAAPPATPAQVIAGGMRITSTSVPAENGTYAVDEAAQGQFTAAYASCAIRQLFPDGTTANYGWYDLGGAPHVIPDCAHLIALAEAASAFVSQVVHGTVPTQPINLP